MLQSLKKSLEWIQLGQKCSFGLKKIFFWNFYLMHFYQSIVPYDTAHFEKYCWTKSWKITLHKFPTSAKKESSGKLHLIDLSLIIDLYHSAKLEKISQNKSWNKSLDNIGSQSGQNCPLDPTENFPGNCTVLILI